MADWPEIMISWIQFRKPHDIVAVIIQSFMVLCSFLIVFGLVYVILLVLAIILHHVICDRDPKRIPDYVKQSIQFSSSESEDEEEEDLNPRESHLGARSKTKYTSETRKIEALEKFMSFETTPN